MDLLIPIVVGTLALLAVFGLFLAFAWRVVVETNTVHIVQSARKTTSYGANMPDGNVYYKIPSFIPIFGVTVIDLPVNNFDLSLHAYKAYDKDRVPFELDLVAFFRIADTNVAAKRVANFNELKTQLQAVVQGAVRKILANEEISKIMGDRSTFGDAFTNEVRTELQNWGVEPVKNLELMDIRDADGSKVIANIMAKKISHIDMESRLEVAKNRQAAETAEIAAKQEVDLRNEVAKQAVGERQAQQLQAVGIANEVSKQEIQAQARVTKEREMDVLSVETQRKAEIAKNAAIVEADQVKATDIIFAEGEKQKTILTAEGVLEQEKRKAEGVQVNGVAAADAQRLMLLAPVEAQITLAEKIAALPEYQAYLVSIEKVKAAQAVGIANAGALEAANIKVIANSGDAASGIASIGDLLGSKGGLAFGALLEGFANTDAGAAALARLGVNTNTIVNNADTPKSA